MIKRFFGHLLRLLALFLLAGVSLQLYFLLRVVLMTVVDPQSTSFQRSEFYRLAVEQHQVLWAQEWRPYARIADSMKRAVIASEDANFTDHSGVEWDAIEKAWDKNQRAEARVERRNEQIERHAAYAAQRAAAHGRTPPPPAKLVSARIVGGSTITQQLAKNLFLSSERSLVRKGEEIMITFMLEGLLTKQRILEIYLNNVEWGEGVFGAQAAARYYFHTNADRLSAYQAAHLAVMLPAPKRFEKRPASPYVIGRSAAVVARMGAVDLP